MGDGVVWGMVSVILAAHAGWEKFRGTRRGAAPPRTYFGVLVDVAHDDCPRYRN